MNFITEPLVIITLYCRSTIHLEYLTMLISTDNIPPARKKKKQAAKIIFLAAAKKLYDMKSDRVSGTPYQIPPTDEIMPDLNHSDIYVTHKIVKRLCA